MQIDKDTQFESARRIGQQWRKNNDATNTEKSYDFLRKWVVPASEISLHHNWIFSHTPKTGGTSFDRFLAGFFQLKDILHLNAPDLNHLPEAVFLKKDFPHLISGHHPMHGLLYQLLPQQKIVHVGLMRRPVDRVVSYYNYLSTREYHALNKRVKDLSFDAFMDLEDLPELCNGQSKRIAGILHSDEIYSENNLYLKAKTAIDECFSMVGVTENMNEFCSFIRKKLKVASFEVPKINSSKVKVRLSDLSLKQRIKIEQLNKVDIQLYEYARSQFIKTIK